MTDEDSFDEEINLDSIMYKEKPVESKKPKDKKEREHVPDLPEMPQFKSEKKSKTHEKPNKLNEDDIKKKRQLILHIQMYLNQFETELKQFKKINLEKKSIEELQDLLKEINVVMDSKSDLKGETQAILGMLQAYEYIMVQYAGVDCNGLTVALSQDPDTIKQIKLLILKHSPLITVEPEARLAVKILMATMQLHTINTYNKQLLQPTENNEKINTLNKEYNDI